MSHCTCETCICFMLKVFINFMFVWLSLLKGVVGGCVLFTCHGQFLWNRGKVRRRGTPKHRGECLFAALKPSFWLESFQLVTVAFTAGFVAGFIFAIWYPYQLLSRESTMDPDADNASEGSRASRGFRRRWARASSEPATERSEVISLHSDHNLDVFPQCLVNTVLRVCR